MDDGCCATAYERTGVDGTAYGVLWDAGGLYVAFGNRGTLAAPAVEISATLPTRFHVAETTHAGLPLTLTTAAPPHYVWQGATLLPQSRGAITIAGHFTTTTPRGFYVTRAGISSTAPERTPADNEGTVTVGVDVASLFLPMTLR
jgi:hypothetical protein